MPIESIAEIADFTEYKKALKRDLELAKSKLQPFLYIEGYKFTGNVGPAIIVGQVESLVIQALKANGTTLSFSTSKTRGSPLPRMSWPRPRAWLSSPSF